MKLLAESKSSAYLIELITAHDKRVSLDECVEALEKNYVRCTCITYKHLNKYLGINDYIIILKLISGRYT